MTEPSRLATLSEGQVLDGVLLTRAQAVALTESRLVTVTPAVQGWRVQASHRIGAVSCGDTEVRVAPKVGTTAVLRMLARAHGAGRLDVDPSRVGMSDDARLSTVLAVLFEQEARSALATGARRGYRTEEQSLPVLRGRLRLIDQSLRRFDVLTPLEVTVDEWTLDTDENRLIRAATRTLLSLPGLPAARKAGLRRLDQQLSEVQRLPPGARPPAWTPSRLNANVQRLLHLADLVLDGAGVEHRAGDAVAHGWVLNMAWLFEAFVAEILKERYSRSARGRLRTQKPRPLDLEGHLHIKPDLEVVYRGTPLAVADTKYKLLGEEGQFPNADAYQLITYATRLGLHDAHLIYAGTPGQIPDTYPILGSAVRLHVHAIDLTADLGDVEQQVARLVDHLTPTSVGQPEPELPRHRTAPA